MLDLSAPKVITFIASVVLALVAVVVHYTRIEVPFTHSGFSILLVGYALLLLATCFGTFSPAIPRAAAAPTEASEAALS
jgi:hypothetical protein